MAFSLSPAVIVNEFDLTTFVPVVGTTEGAYAGDFVWGPIDKVMFITTEGELVSTFGKPTNDTFVSFFSAANFLSYANNLRLVRSANTAAALNAVSGNTAILIKNRDDYEYDYLDLSAANTVGMYAARYASDLGNSLKVSTFAGQNTTQFSNWAYHEEFDAVPDTSVWAEKKNGYYDEMHIIVIDEDGRITGTANTILEKFAFVSKASDARNDDGTSNYYVNVINERSQYIYMMNSPTGMAANVANVAITAQGTGYSNGFINFTGNFGSGANAAITCNASGYITTVTLNNAGTGYALNEALVADLSDLGGSNGAISVTLQAEPEWANWGAEGAGTVFRQNTSVYTASLAGGASAAPTDGNLAISYDLFKNAEEVDVSLVITGDHSKTIQQYVIDNIAETRKDCVAFLSPTMANVVNNRGEETADCIAYRNAIARSTSYGFMDSGWKYQLDKYNNTNRWVPLNADIAGLCVRTDFERDPWYSPAGLNRGQIKNVIKLAWNPSKPNRDDLYKNGINPVVTFPGEGTILFGDKTMLSRPSAFDRINVRRLFIVMEKAIAKAARSSLFELNNAFTRAAFVALVEPYLRDIKGRNGIYDYRVICDSSNNTGAVIDRNEFVGTILVKPAKSINAIYLNFVAVGTNAVFEEIQTQF